MDNLKKESNKKEDFFLPILKEKYEVFRKKHNMPLFYELNKAFDIEELDCDSDFLLRKIRRYISEKIAGYMRFIEVLLNPSNAPIFFFKLIKKIDNSDKETLSEMYDNLGKVELETISLDLEYNEEKEAEFIKKLFEMFNSKIKNNLLGILLKLGNGDNNKKKDVNGSYFG